MKGCPLKFAGAEAFEMIDAVAEYERGIPPVAGGSLDQAQVFLEAARFIREERKRWDRSDPSDRSDHSEG